MTPTDLRTTLTLIAELWPKAEWPKLLAEETSRRISGLSLEAAQARAALVNLRAGMKWKTIEPVEVLAALQAAVSSPRATAGKGTLEGCAARLESHRAADPERFALVQLDAHGSLPNVPIPFPQTPHAYGRISSIAGWMLARLDDPSGYRPSPGALARHAHYVRVKEAFHARGHRGPEVARAAMLRALTDDAPAMLAWLEEQGLSDPLAT